MLRFEVLGHSCHRTLVEQAGPADVEPLLEDDYSFVVSYGTFEDDRYRVEHKTSAMLDLTDGIDAVFSRFSATTRNEVRGSHKLEELEFHRGFDDLHFDELYEFHRGCEADRDWIPVPPDEFARSDVFIATHLGVPIAGMTSYSEGERVRVARIFSSKRSKRSEVLTNRVYGCAQKRLVQEVCEHAIAGGARSVDLGGVDPDDPTKAGIAQFKGSFGPELLPVVVARAASPAFVEAAPAIRAKGWDIA